MDHVIDARGLSCPLPVVNTKNEMNRMEPGETAVVLVDNEIAVQNLTKFAGVRGYTVRAEKQAEREYRVRITKGGADTGNAAEAGGAETAREAAPAESREPVACEPDRKNRNVVVLSSDTMGTGEEALGQVLMKAFLFALTKQDVYPASVLLYNRGAFLSCEGSDSLEDLRFLEAQGTQIMTCGTCLNYYGLTASLAVGSITNMYDIVEIMTNASHILKP